MQFFLKFIFFLVTMYRICGLPHAISPVRNSLRSLSSAKKEGFQLVLVRHGESTWNSENLFTGWYDCPLSAKGRQEAEAAGKLLSQHNFKFDVAFSSYLQRAIRTLWYSLEETGHMHIPIHTAWELNER
jgi:2,3-bisphosphoglycerate-dependent phosphoglycerate mutase